MNGDTALRVERAGATVTLTFDRPGKRNSVRRETVAHLLDELEAARDARVVVLTGANGDYTAGQDLDEVDMMLRSHPRDTTPVEQMQEVTRRLLAHPAVIITAMDGVSVGFGAESALAADIRLAGPRLRMGFPEASRAMVQTNGVLWLLPRIIGHGRAAELLLTARLLGAEEALRCGLVSAVHDDVRAAAADVATRIGLLSPGSLSRIKAMLRRTWTSTIAEVMEAETAGMLECLASDDLVEGTRAFLEKRAPVYAGF